MWPYQVKEEGVETGAKTHRGEDAQADPVGAPQCLLLHVTHILQREARERDGQPHGRDTCTECKENKKGGGGAQREEGRDRDRVKEGMRVKVCNTEGTLKGGRGQVSGREREGEEESEGETFGDRGCC